MNQALRVFLGLGLQTKEGYSLTDRLLGFLTLVPPIFLFLTPINAASAVVLSIRGYPSWKEGLIGFLAVAFAGGGVVVFNNYVDRIRDKTIWPKRSIPSGRIKAHHALILVIVLFTTALLLTWFVFNPSTFYILLLAVLLGCLYSAYLRDRVGYLSLPPIIGLIYIGGWSVLAPETLFSSFLPWYLYLLGVSWQAAHIMVYYPVHITYRHNNDSTVRLPAFFFKPSVTVAAVIALGFTCLTFLMGGFLTILADLSIIYALLIVVAGIFALRSTIRLLQDASSHEKGIKAFASLTIFRLTISVAILMDIFIQGL